MRGQFDFTIDKSSLTKFKAKCEATIKNVETGTKKATELACQEILAESLKQVPVDTATLKDSAFYKVQRSADISSYRYEGTVGYGGNGDPVNPRTGRPASSYMLAVHEDLGTLHVTGKAKFLEDPVRDYAARRFRSAVLECIRESLSE